MYGINSIYEKFESDSTLILFIGVITPIVIYASSIRTFYSMFKIMIFSNVEAGK